MGAKFGPKPADHPSVGEKCKVCGREFREGDYTTLVPLGPGDDEERSKAEQGKPYNAVAIEVHWECADISYKNEQ